MQPKTKVICLIPIKNEDWIIKKCIETAYPWADHIIISDQKSIDKSVEIASQFEKVQIIHNETEGFNEVIMRQLLLDEARKIECDKRIIFYIDADESLSANFLNSPEWKTIMNLEQGTFITAQLINLVEDGKKYFTVPARFFIGFVDSPSLNFVGAKIHGNRVPINLNNPVLELNDIKLLHYSRLNQRRMIAKSRWYQCTEIILETSPIISVIRKYNSYGKIKRDYKAINELWFDGYKSKGLDVTSHITYNRYEWYDYEVLRFFDEYGVRKFELLDIWNFDWESFYKEQNLNFKHKRSLKGKVVRAYIRKTQGIKNRRTIRFVDEILSKFI